MLVRRIALWNRKWPGQDVEERVEGAGCFAGCSRNLKPKLTKKLLNNVEHWFKRNKTGMFGAVTAGEPAIQIQGQKKMLSHVFPK